MSATATGAPRVISRSIGTLHGETAPIEVGEHFVLAGLEWLHPEHPRIELRALGVDHRWSRWTPASVTGHDADGGRAPSPLAFGEPVWTGPAIAVQLRSERPVGAVSVHLVPARRPAGHLAGESGRVAFAARGRRTASGLPLATPDLPAGAGQPPIIAREAWAGGRNGPAAIPEYGDVRMAFIHHSDGANAYSRAQVPEVLLSIYDFHVHVRGWNDIGYNFAIDRYGQIWEARAGGIDQAVVGAQAGGYNLESTGVVMLGTYSQALPTPAALDALARLLAWKLPLHGVPVSGRVTVEVDPPAAYYTRFRPGQHVHLPRIAGHRDGCQTDCPGTRLYDHLPQVRAAVAKLVKPSDQAQLTIGFETGKGSQASPGERVKRASYLQLVSNRIVIGDKVVVHGTLRTGSGSPIAGAPVELQAVLGETERSLATVTTDAKGRWSATLEPRSNVLIRALHAAAPATASPLAVIGVAPKLTLALDDAAKQQFSGTITQGREHLMLVVHYAQGRHRLVEHVHVPVHHGEFRHRLRLRRGRYVVQAHNVANAQHVEAFSERIHLTVR